MAVIEVNKDNFESEVLKSDKIVIADFNAGWCGPCKMLKPVLDEFSEEHSEVKIVSIDMDEEDDLADEYDVSSIPCLVIFKNGEEVERSIGFKTKDQIADLLGGV